MLFPYKRGWTGGGDTAIKGAGTGGKGGGEKRDRAGEEGVGVGNFLAGEVIPKFVVFY